MIHKKGELYQRAKIKTPLSKRDLKIIAKKKMTKIPTKSTKQSKT